MYMFIVHRVYIIISHFIKRVTIELPNKSFKRIKVHQKVSLEKLNK